MGCRGETPNGVAEPQTRSVSFGLLKAKQSFAPYGEAVNARSAKELPPLSEIKKPFEKRFPNGGLLYKIACCVVDSAAGRTRFGKRFPNG